MVKRFLTSIITVAVLMGALTACGSSSEGDAKLWVTDYLVEAFEPAWELLEIKSLTARDFVKECYLDEFEAFSYRNGEDDYWQITKSNFIDGSYSGVRNSEANENVITCLTDRTTGAEFARLNNADLSNAVTFEKDTRPMELSWNSFLELVDSGLIEEMTYDINTGEIQATDVFGNNGITSGPLELSIREQKLLTQNITYLIQTPDQEPQLCESFLAEDIKIGQLAQFSFPKCLVSHGSFTVKAINSSGCLWTVRSPSYNENIVGLTYDEAIVLIPESDSYDRPYQSITSSGCSDWVRN